MFADDITASDVLSFDTFKDTSHTDERYRECLKINLYLYVVM